MKTTGIKRTAHQRLKSRHARRAPNRVGTYICAAVFWGLFVMYCVVRALN